MKCPKITNLGKFDLFMHTLFADTPLVDAPLVLLDMFTRTSLTFTRVPAKVPHIHQSSGEGAFCMWMAFRMCPTMCASPLPVLGPDSQRGLVNAPRQESNTPPPHFYLNHLRPVIIKPVGGFSKSAIRI